MSDREFGEFFKTVAGNGVHDPYPYQKRLAGGDDGRVCESLLIDIPTGLGKTAAVTIAWLWNRVSGFTTSFRCRLVSISRNFAKPSSTLSPKL